MMANSQKVAVVGASGVVGRALVEHLRQSETPVVGLSRRPPVDLADAPFQPLDLTNAAECKRIAKSTLSDVTHLVYTALFEKPGLISGWQEQDQMQTNLTMLRNLLGPLKTGSKLRHVTLLQGTKAYGAHVEPMKIPGLESDPRHLHENFYWLQEDYLRDLCGGTNLQFTIWRPQVIFGHALHAPMNMLAAIGVYAALQKDQSLPLTYPGGPSAVSEAIDADLLAKAIGLSFDNDAFSNQTFNITNGDVFRWQDTWPTLAQIFGMEPGEPDRRLLSESMYDRENDWSQLISRHGLKPYTIRELVGDSFYYADAMFNTYGNTAPPPAILSTIKLRHAGFTECIDTNVMLARWFHKLAQLKILPKLL
ncbi:NAD-dependent epimerase/dehydratase family protein [Gammaproteobacteria bacterium]|nr:NAD-dependent epimerase/dehydratase family protein [Gammaproteobacteria bacterium]